MLERLKKEYKDTANMLEKLEKERTEIVHQMGCLNGKKSRLNYQIKTLKEGHYNNSITIKEKETIIAYKLNPNKLKIDIESLAKSISQLKEEKKNKTSYYFEDINGFMDTLQQHEIAHAKCLGMLYMLEEEEG